jgi:hypothetical protein
MSNYFFKISDFMNFLGDLDDMIRSFNETFLDTYFLDDNDPVYLIYEFYENWIDINESLDKHHTLKEKFLLSSSPYGPFEKNCIEIPSCIKDIQRMRSFTVVITLYSVYYGIGGMMINFVN